MGLDRLKMLEFTCYNPLIFVALADIEHTRSRKYEAPYDCGGIRPFLADPLFNGQLPQATYGQHGAVRVLH